MKWSFLAPDRSTTKEAGHHTWDVVETRTVDCAAGEPVDAEVSVRPVQVAGWEPAQLTATNTVTITI